MVFAWTKKESKNLEKARNAGVRVPLAIGYTENALVMEFIGSKDLVANRLSVDAPKDPKKFFNKIIENIKKLYKIKLVHADLSPFNILNHNQEPVFIDFSQTTTLNDSRAQEYLKRDVKNICTYFKKQGLKPDETKVLKTIHKT